MAGLGSEDWSEIRQLWALGHLLRLADGLFLQQQLWGPLALSPQSCGCREPPVSGLATISLVLSLP